jgi:hypothetical protein
MQIKTVLLITHLEIVNQLLLIVNSLKDWATGTSCFLLQFLNVFLIFNID